MTLLPRKWFEGDAVALAPKLLGKVVKRGSCVGVIVETEAYTTDSSSHASKKTKRSLPMFETHGCWYVYFTYGMHWCANVTTNKGSAGAVLIRAVEPVEGLALMRKRRGLGMLNIPKPRRSDKNLCNGPAKFCQAFGVTGRENTRPVDEAFGIYELKKGERIGSKNTIIYDSVLPKDKIGVSGRIGIRKGAELPWRFYIKGNPFVSR